jgi:NOL1/NOP2/fmu family ribosome biogenesis protein
MLRPGGMIAYSTCTFAREEDEAVIEEILHRYPELSLADAEPAEGFVHGAAPCEKSLRIWPHHVKGEGHFLALLRKADSENIVSESGTGAANAGNRPFAKSGQISAGTAARTLPRYSEAEIQKNHRKIPEEILEFLAVLPEKLWKNTIFEQIGEQCLLLPPYQLPGGLRYLRTGILLGTLKRGRFEPSQALAMLLQAEDFPLVLDLSAEDERVIRYLKGETVELSQEEAARIQEIQKREAKGRAPQNKGAQKKETSGRDASGRKGWILICVDGFGLGWGKYASGSVKNKYYPGWRLQ